MPAERQPTADRQRRADAQPAGHRRAPRRRHQAVRRHRRAAGRRLKIRRGELMTLLGPSGCGKTTLLNLVAGFLAPDAGEHHHRRRAGHRRAALQARDRHRVPELRAVPAHGRRGQRRLRLEDARRRARTRSRQRVADVLALVKLTGLEDRRPRQLSGGQQQRVALARALVIRPKVLLLDEPFSALDKNLRASMQVEVKEIQRRLGVTTIFVTHDQSEALSLSDRIAVMSEGRIRQYRDAGRDLSPAGRPLRRLVHRRRQRAARAARPRRRRGRDHRARCRAGRGALRGPRRSRTGSARRPLPAPRQLGIAEAGAPAATEGIVAAHVYQGGHVDLYAEVPEVAGGRLLIRLAGTEAITRWPIGARIAVAVGDERGEWPFRAAGISVGASRRQANLVVAKRALPCHAGTRSRHRCNGRAGADA